MNAQPTTLEVAQSIIAVDRQEARQMLQALGRDLDELHLREVNGTLRAGHVWDLMQSAQHVYRRLTRIEALEELKP